MIIRNKNLPAFSRFLDDDFFDRDWGSGIQSTVPSVNISETENNFEVEMAAPGLKKEDFKIELDGNMLTISAEKKEEIKDENKDEKFSRREFSYQSFQRSFQLPKDVVDEDKVKAYYQDGVLKLSIPKKEEAKKKSPRKIQIM
jgi:HSP20 family protein